jgi:phage terminase Nu1 subunit (DNA packaging protein)
VSYRAQLWSVNGLSVEFKLDRRTVAKRIESVPPAKSDGRTAMWRIADVAPLLVQSERSTGNLADDEKRRAAAEADIAEMKAGAMKGDLVSAEEMGKEIDRAVASVRARLLAVPNKLAPILRPDDPSFARRSLEAAMLEVLEEMRGISLDEDQDEDEPMPEAA